MPHEGKGLMRNWCVQEEKRHQHDTQSWSIGHQNYVFCRFLYKYFTLSLCHMIYSLSALNINCRVKTLQGKFKMFEVKFCRKS